MFTKEQNRQLIEKYPYLQPVNIWTNKVDENFDFEYLVGDFDIPRGWNRLFLIFCKKLRPHLEKADLLCSFRFTSVKEKFGTLRLYTSCLPASCSGLISLYEAYSRYVCFMCGEPAMYTTPGWISYLCANCATGEEDICKKICKKSVHTVVTYENNSKVTININRSFRALDKEYNYVRQLSSNDFFNYLMQD